MAKPKVVPGPGNPDGPAPEDVKAKAEAESPEGGKGEPGKPPEVTREFQIDSFQSAALKAAQENKNRVENEFRAAATDFADMVEAVVDNINERLKINPPMKVESVRFINVKKGFIRIAIPKDEKPAKGKK